MSTKVNEKDRLRLNGWINPARSKRTFTKIQMRNALQEAAKSSSPPLTRDAYQTYYNKTDNAPHPYTIIRRYGKWSEALKDADLPRQNRGAYSNRINDQKCLDGIMAARKRLGYLPSVSEYTELWKKTLKNQGYPSPSTIRAKFGTWRIACKKALEQ